MILPLLLTCAPAVPPLPQNADTAPPPGLVYLVGGRTTIGSTVKEIEELVKDVSEAKLVVRSLDAETPQHQMSVEPYHIGLTEVTNEQYAVFVSATGHRPPLAWAGDAIEEGRLAYFEEVKRRRDANEPAPPPFDPGDFWAENWKGKPWAVPEGDEQRPVARVDYSDVTAYCRWAGVRLPTEFEYQHAARGSSKDPFPWGEDWEVGKFCATAEMRRISRTFKVGSFPDGASRDGLHDLAGNVWEWTQSPYVAYPKFEKNKYKIPGSRQKFAVPHPNWDGNQRVVVGGCYETSKMVARCTVRRGTERTQMTNGLGFRVAATPIPARDLVEHVWMQDLRNAEGRPSGVSYENSLVMGRDRWDHTDGVEGAPEGYRVITNYEYIAFVPVEEMQETQDSAYRNASRIAPQHLGFLTLSMPVIEPPMSPGTYLIAFRAKGETEFEKPKEDKDKQDQDPADKPKPKPEKPEDPLAGVIDFTVDNLLFYDAATGALTAHMPVQGVAFRKTDGTAGFEPVDKDKKVEDPADPDKTITIKERWLRVKAEVTTRQSRRVLPFRFDLRVGDDYWEKKWR